MSPTNEGKPDLGAGSSEANETGSSPLAASNGTATSRRHVLATAASAGVAAIAGIGRVRAAQSAAGDELWHFHTTWESVSSPTVVDGRVYVAADSRRTVDRIYALDAANGDELWGKEYYNEATRATPSVVGGTVYAAGVRLSALDARTGETRWSSQDWEWGRPRPNIRTSPTVIDGTIFTSAFSTDLHAYNAQTGAVRWKQLGSNEWEAGSPIVVDETVYVVEPSRSESDTGDVTGPGTAIAAYDSTSGTERWHWDRGTDSLGSLTAANGTLFVADHERGRVHALDRQNGERRWTVSTDHALETRPTVVDDALFVGGEGTMHAIGIDEGSKRRRYDAAVSVPIPGHYQAPTVVGDTLFAGDSSSIYALDLVDGSVSWRFETGTDMIASPIVVDGTLYTGTHDGIIYALDAGVSGSSEDSRVLLGTDGHHHAWAETAAIGSGPAEFTVEIDTESDSAVAAAETEVRITVENVGEKPGERTVRFSAPGLVVGDSESNTYHFEESVALDVGESRTLTKTVYPLRRYEGREITMKARLFEDEDKTTISVTRPPSGLGQFSDVAPVAALGGAGGAAYLVKRRFDSDDSNE